MVALGITPTVHRGRVYFCEVGGRGGVEETKRVKCKNCNKPYDGEIKYYVRKDGRKVYRVYPYCSPFCYREWYHKTVNT